MSPFLPVGLTIGFDAPLLLFWLAAAGIPLLLTGLARRRLPRIAFGGLQLLREAARSTSVRAVPVGWLILALRMVLLAAAVLAAASPYFVTGTPAPTSSGNHGDVAAVWLVAGKQPVEMTAVNEPTSKAIAAALAATGDGLKPIVTETKTSLAEGMTTSRPGDVLIICDGLALSQQEASAWWQWIENGGVAVVLLGPETLRSPDWPTWRASLADRTGLTFSEVSETGGSQLLVKPALLDEGPAARPAAGGLVSLPGPTIDRLVGMKLPEPSQGLEAFAVTGKRQLPAAVCQTVGRGALTISALPLSLRVTAPADSVAGRWSDLTAWPVFLPYLRGLIRETVACCRPLRGRPSGWWSMRLLPGLLLVVAVLALVGETMLTSGGFADEREGPGWRGLQSVRWPAGLGRVVALAALVAVAWQVLRRPNAVEHPQEVAAPVPGQSAIDRVEVELPPLCWPGEEVEIPVSCVGPLTSPTRLVLDGPEGRLAEAVLPSAGGTAKAASDRVTVRLLWSVAKDTPPGPCRLQLRCLPAAGENAEISGFSPRLLEAMTTIADRPASLLLVDAEPRFEYRFARQAVAGDPRFTVTTRLLAADQPIAAGDWAKHDVVWLGDCLGLPSAADGELPSGLSAAALATLGQQLAAGRLAVAWLPGERFRQIGFAVGRAANWLPVEPLGPLSPPLRTGAGLALMPRPAGIVSGWLPDVPASLGQIYGLLEPVSLRATTVTLATAAAGVTQAAEPAIVLGRYGRGTILGHLCETWRWRAERLPDGRNLHETFWRQTLCRLATAPLMQRLGVDTEAIEWPQRFGRQQPVEAGRLAEQDQFGSGQSWHRLRHLLLATLVAACLVAWWTWPARPQGGEA